MGIFVTRQDTSRVSETEWKIRFRKFEIFKTQNRLLKNRRYIPISPITLISTYFLASMAIFLGKMGLLPKMLPFWGKIKTRFRVKRFHFPHFLPQTPCWVKNTFYPEKSVIKVSGKSWFRSPDFQLSHGPCELRMPNLSDRKLSGINIYPPLNPILKSQLKSLGILR